MRDLKILFDNNKQWVEKHIGNDPEYFLRMSKGQQPRYLWIGCSDSRIPANEVVGLEPGELFVHRNVANLFVHTDLNCLSVLQYAVDVLEIEHIIVCGHYGCGGVAAAMKDQQLGIMDNWLRNIRDIYANSQFELDAMEDPVLRNNRLVELNVLQQVNNVCHTTIVQNAWARKQPLCLHGWVYELETGKLRDLNCCISSLQQVEEVYLTR
ncbi:putative carbonic anhydrase [Candidatus Protochlamydia naegleriophila]|uniref:Carbonic anhydrase n=1 Tax=Candidatus Protochlamydia naegleriophila TaxID=389348 RepID=A0A0U5JJ06_9BACT|nr:carbonate dehydratase [Candidatus Protochlamydia naegleriophila]CUI17957.1 putative carbonic anhydrase [Candidatus Protochlamydia naegleriophila]